MTLTLQSVPAGSLNYPAIIDANWAAIEAAVNSLQSQISAAVGDGALLITDAFDRDGIVGAASYQLDLASYAGGGQITIGRRPAPISIFGDQNVSIAWITAAGQQQRVTQVGDVLLDFSGIVSGLPTTAYIGIPSGGTAQVFPDTATPNVLYIYSVCWDGFTLTCMERIAPILPGYTAEQALVANPRLVQSYDPDADFLTDAGGKVSIVFPGAADDNLVGIDGAVEVVGFMVAFHQSGEDGLDAPGGMSPDNLLTLEIHDTEGVRWNNEDIVFDASNAPDTIYASVAPAIGADKFLTEFSAFHVIATIVGSAIISARGYTLGVFVRPLIGTAIPKDSTKVNLI
ncbi:MAG TPA: hypothetical protein VG457_13015 [Planctomycetota bacterium]|jgi:hypothetical protein|nr:hypothetical protein [Planctomycetota bacterium]